MLDIKEIIAQLSEEEAKEFGKVLIESKAEKTATLFNLLQQDGHSDKKILEILSINSTAYYTLRSRLYDKLQDFMVQKIDGPRMDILEKVNNIDHIIFNYPTTQAFTILQKFESELKKYDHPEYLLKVYNGLMRLSKSSEQYFHYSQLYNSNLTFLIDYEKAQQLLGDFIRAMGAHLLSRNPEYIDRLHLIAEQLSELCQQYPDSSRIYILYAIVSSHYQLYVEEDEQEVDLESIEDIVKKAMAILKSKKKDHFFGNLMLLFNYLNYRYYSKYGIRKKEEEYYTKVADDLVKFLNGYGFYAIPTRFLGGMLKRALRNGETGALELSNRKLQRQYDIGPDDLVNYFNYKMHLALSSFYRGRFEETHDQLNEIRNNVSLKNYPHADMELRLFLAINYSITGELEMSNSLLKSINRKLKSIDYHDYENLKILRKIIQSSLRTPSRERVRKALQLADEYKHLNRGPYRLLDGLDVNEELIKKMIRF